MITPTTRIGDSIMTFTQKHTYSIKSSSDGIGFLVVDETGSPWGYHTCRINAEFQIGFLSHGVSIEQQIQEFDQAFD